MLAYHVVTDRPMALGQRHRRWGTPIRKGRRNAPGGICGRRVWKGRKGNGRIDGKIQ